MNPSWVLRNQSLSPGSCDADIFAFTEVRTVDVSVDTKVDFGQNVVNKSDFQTSPKQSSDYPRQGSRLSKLKATTSLQQYRNYYECEYCPLKSKDRSP